MEIIILNYVKLKIINVEDKIINYCVILILKQFMFDCKN